MNNVNFYGSLDSEPELSGMPGRDVCEFWLAVDGARDVHRLYVRVVALRELALRLVRELSEGDRVVIAGHLRSDRLPGKRRFYRHTVLARVVDSVDARPGLGGGGG
jgi:single-stranded DNA-binding protein